MKTYKIFPLFLFGILSFLPTKSQNKKSLFTIGKEKHYNAEFNYAFSKNSLSTEIRKDSINSYLNLYINFRLKVKEAKDLGYDTTQSFKEEFKLYKNQLDASYLTPKKEEDALVKEAYERNKWEVKASHILIRVPKDASQQDTLEAYKKINSIRERALSGEDFSELAKAKSEDPSAKQNGGNLGYFSVFQMVYPFESAAYKTPVGEVSKPIRTQFGYHIIKTIDKRAYKGKIKVAHIMIRATAKNAIDVQKKAKQKIYAIDSLLKIGGSWNELCKKYSEDKNSVPQNGELKPFGRGQIVPEFEQAAFNIPKIDEVSEPVRTRFGWHIIKLIERMPLGTFEEEEPKLARRIKSDDRAKMPQAEMLKTLKKENKFYKNEAIINKLLQIPPSVTVNNKWRFDSTYLSNTVVLFSVGNISITSGEFIKSVASKPFDKKVGVKEQMQKLLVSYEDSLIISYEKEKLPQKFPDYAFLVQEYYDGILLFSIMEDSVWNLSMNDSLNLIHYFEANKNNYSTIIKDTTLFSSDLRSTLKNLEASTQQKINIKDWETLKSNLIKENNVSPLTLQIISKDSLNWNQIINTDNSNKTEPFEKNNRWYWIKVTDLTKQQSLHEVKGKVIADYQQYLDKSWIERLKKKYPVKINKKSLNKVYAHFKAIN